jgi:hypothetical protein
VCSEIDRGQSGIPMSSIVLRDLVHIGKMALADDIALRLRYAATARD